MDTSGFSTVGRYGTISLMKRNEEHTVVTSFGIDTEELTFGRETTCGVRLYYADVALLHCKVVFEERKAFLAVLGESGVLVDGCKVFPRTSNNLLTIIPLANNSEFEIHGKRFRFSYPPKEIRATLFATPARPRNRALRLSMIHSAQVFSPQPSKDPRENLRILQSPLQNSFKSPVKAAVQEEDEIILVQGNHPRVVQEDRDLVILEDVVLASPPPSKPHANLEHPQTPPRRKSLGGNALHRAVLIRSAQRAVLKAEKEREEEEEEMEVLGAVVSADDENECENNEREDIEMNLPTDDEDYADETEQPARDNQKPMWRKSLEKIMWPFGGSEDANVADDDGCTGGDFEDDEDVSTPPSSDLYSTVADSRTDELEEEDEDETEAPALLPSCSNLQYTPIKRTLGSFMTPQAKSGQPHANRATDDRSAIGRFSLGGGEARRVVVQQPWRVRDLVIPPLTATLSSSTRSPVKVANSSAMTVQAPDVMVSPERTRTPRRTPARPALTEEERKAIQERRRSALKEVGPFFPGGAPGLSPAKPKSSGSSSSPVKVASSRLYNSPMKGHTIHEEDDTMKDNGAVQEKEEEEEEDPRSLLDRMKETVDGMRRRRSVALGITTPGPPRPLFARVTTPQRPLSRPELPEMVDSAVDESNEMAEQEVFSLLRPGARDEVVSRLTPAILEVGSSVEGPIPLPTVVVDPVDEEGSPEVQGTPQIQEQPIRAKEGRSRLLRAPKSIDVAAGPSEPNVEKEQKEVNAKPRSRSRSTGPATRRSRSRTPQPPVPEEESAEVPRTTKSSTTTIGGPTVAASRRTRKATAEPEDQQQQLMAVPLPATGKRGRKAPADVAVEQPEQDIEKPKGKAKALPVKRGREADLSVEDEQHVDSRGDDRGAEGCLEITTTPAAAPAKRGRSRRAVQKTLDQEESTPQESTPQESTPPIPVIVKTGTKKTMTPSGSNGSRIRGTRTKAAVAKAAVQIGGDDDDDEDLLDLYNAVEDEVDEDADLPGPPPPSRINKTKTKSRKKAATTIAVKQEQDDEQTFSDLEEEARLATTKGIATRASIGTRNSGRTTPTAKTPAAKNGGRKTRAKTPATAPASTTALIGSDKEKDKENTPDSAGAGGSGNLLPSMSGDGEDSGQTQTQAQGVPVKVRVSRSRGGERAEGTTTVKLRTGSATATRSASKAVKVEVVEEAEVAVVETVRVRRTRTKTKTG